MHFLLMVLSLFIYKGVDCAILGNVTVPPMVLIDGTDDLPTVLLDCQIDVNDNTSFVVIKWFKDNQAVYQWIRGKKPTVFPLFKGKVDEEYLASAEQNQNFQSLVLSAPDINTTGVYKCVAQTARETEAIEQHLQVINIANHSLKFFHQNFDNETRFVCVVDNVYPSPTIQFSIDGDTDIPLQTLKINKYEDGFYNGTATAVTMDFDKRKYTYKCTVTFMDLNFNLSATISSGKIALAITTYPILLVIFLLFV